MYILTYNIHSSPIDDQCSLLLLVSILVFPGLLLINPRCACAARVTVYSWVCLFVCLSVCPCFNSPLDCLFVPQTISSTARVTTINRAVFSEYAPLQRSDRCQHNTHTNVSHFSLCGKRACALFLPRVGSRHFFPLERRRRRSEIT